MTITSHLLSPTFPLPSSILEELSNDSPLDEISNHTGSVRRHIFNHGLPDKDTKQVQRSMLFFVYQTGRYGPQNGFRLVFVHRGFVIPAKSQDENANQDGTGEEDDEIYMVEKPIPQGHMEVVVLGKAPPRIEDPEE